jgi:hypothetical protein
MSADDVAVLVAAGVAAVAAAVSLVAVVLLARRIAELRQLVRDLRRETLPLVHEARVVVEEAATEMVRVGDVLGSAEAVSATVDSASRLAYRAFANPLVKVLAFGTGAGAAARRLVGRTGPDPSAPRGRPVRAAAADTAADPLADTTTGALAPSPSAARRHRRSRVRR